MKLAVATSTSQSHPHPSDYFILSSSSSSHFTRYILTDRRRVNCGFEDIWREFHTSWACTQCRMSNKNNPPATQNSQREIFGD